MDVAFQRGPGSQTEEPRALLFPFTSSSNALEDELSCHRLAAGGGFGRPARYLVHYIYSEDLHHFPSSSNACDLERSCRPLPAGEGVTALCPWGHRDPQIEKHCSHDVRGKTYRNIIITCTHTIERHTDRDTYTHRHRYTHTETHTLPQHTPLHAEHLTHNSHSDFTRDEKCFRATRRLVFYLAWTKILINYVARQGTQSLGEIHCIGERRQRLRLAVRRCHDCVRAGVSCPETRNFACGASAESCRIARCLSTPKLFRKLHV